MSERNILIVDDDITSLDIVSFLFEKKGFKVNRCADGFAAIEYTKTKTPDLIIIDLRMPKINGADTVKKIREMGLSEVPIIAFTAVDEQQVHDEAKLAGCNRVLTKPCRPEKLIKNIEELLPTN